MIAGFGGAILLSAQSALRSGAGMVSVATRSEHVPAALARIPEAMVLGTSSANQLMGLLQKVSVLVVGPGLGQGVVGTQSAVGGGQRAACRKSGTPMR